MQTIKLSIIFFVAFLTIGCASNSDVKNLQSQIELLKPQIVALSSDAAFSKATATNAASKATNAEIIASEKARRLLDISSKMDPLILIRPRNINR